MNTRRKIGRLSVCLAAAGWACAARAQEPENSPAPRPEPSAQDPGSDSSLRDVTLDRIQPEVFFRRETTGLRQRVTLFFLNPSGRARPCALEFRAGALRETYDLGATGVEPASMFIPDLREPQAVRFILREGDRILSDKRLDWTPTRHWSVYLTQRSHFDPGYTDLPSNVMAEYLDILDQVVDYCGRTEGWPEDCRFRYVVEQAWIAAHYLENRPPAQAERFAHFCRVGQIEVNAFFANMTSDLLGPEEAARLLYPAQELKRRYGIPIRTAEHNDVPGMNWAYVPLLAGVGVRYLAPALPSYFAWRIKAANHYDEAKLRPFGFVGVWHWQGRTRDDRVLVYLSGQNSCGCKTLNALQADLPGLLDGLQARGYPYSVFRHVLAGGGRDNAPANFDWAPFVRDWNRRWAFPRLVLATNFAFFTALEAELGPEVPVWRGTLPCTDYPIGALSTAQDTGISRVAANTLFAAERWAALSAALAQSPYPRRSLNTAYADLLKFDEHVWGFRHPTGWAMEASKKERAVYASRAAALAEDVESKALNRLADTLALPGPGPHLVVFNPLEFDRTELAAVPFCATETCGLPMITVLKTPGEWPSVLHASAWGRNVHHLKSFIGDEAFQVLDAQTQEPVPHQVIDRLDQADPAYFAGERAALGQVLKEMGRVLLVEARDVPALGYKTYTIAKGKAPLPAPPGAALSAKDRVLENKYFRLELDGSTGCVKSLKDKDLDRELVDQRAPLQLGQPFTKAVIDGRIESLEGPVRLEMESGALLAVARARGRAPGLLEWSVDICLPRDAKRVDFRFRLFKDADGTRRHYIAFPFNVERPRFVLDSTLGPVHPVTDQLPGTVTDYYAARQWVAVSEGAAGPAVVLHARQAPMIQCGGNWPDYVSQAHHRVTPPDFHHAFVKSQDAWGSGHLYSYVANNNFITNFYVSQPGPIVLDYSLTAHAGGLRAHRRFGWGAACPLAAVVLPGPQAGSRPLSGRFLELSAPNVTVTTLKRAEDGPDLVARLLETEGRDTTLRLRLTDLRVVRAYAANLAEEPQAPLRLADDQAVPVTIPAWGLVTIRLQVTSLRTP
jgi:alpha-mannosidase